MGWSGPTVPSKFRNYARASHRPAPLRHARRIGRATLRLVRHANRPARDPEISLRTRRMPPPCQPNRVLSRLGAWPAPPEAAAERRGIQQVTVESEFGHRHVREFPLKGLPVS